MLIGPVCSPSISRIRPSTFTMNRARGKEKESYGKRYFIFNLEVDVQFTIIYHVRNIAEAASLCSRQLDSQGLIARQQYNKENVRVSKEFTKRGFYGVDQKQLELVLFFEYYRIA